MINLQNPYAYEASWSNILRKAHLEAGVERIVITLLNDILDDLGKWPKLSAEDTPNFNRTKLQTIYGLTAPSVPDGMILDDSVNYRQAMCNPKGYNPKGKPQPRALIEMKDCDKNPYYDAFTGKGAGEVIQELKEELENESDIKDIIKEILNTGCKLKIGQSEQFKDKWEVEVSSHKGTDGAYPIEITDPSRTVATLHQLDTYLLDLYACDNIKYVIWTNILCWRIWTKDASGKIKKDWDQEIGDVNIDQNEFYALIKYLNSILSTL